MVFGLNLQISGICGLIVSAIQPQGSLRMPLKFIVKGWWVAHKLYINQQLW